LRRDIDARRLVRDFDALAATACRERKVNANRLTNSDDDAVSLLRGECAFGRDDAVATDRYRRRAEETFSVACELALAAGLLVADDDSGTRNSGAGSICDGAADGSADHLRLQRRGAKYECYYDTGDG